LVSSVTFSDLLRSGRNTVEPHPADADIEIIAAIERHTERLAADWANTSIS